jgi:hypothetical protein
MHVGRFRCDPLASHWGAAVGTPQLCRAMVAERNRVGLTPLPLVHPCGVVRRHVHLDRARTVGEVPGISGGAYFADALRVGARACLLAGLVVIPAVGIGTVAVVPGFLAACLVKRAYPSAGIRGAGPEERFDPGNHHAGRCKRWEGCQLSSGSMKAVHSAGLQNCLCLSQWPDHDATRLEE